MSEKNDPRQAIMDMASSLRDIFKNYSRHSRTRAWKALTSGKGKVEIDKILVTPARTLNTIRTLQFSEWLNQVESNSIENSLRNDSSNAGVIDGR